MVKIKKGVFLAPYGLDSEGKPIQCGIRTYVNFLQRAAANPFYIISESPGSTPPETNNVIATIDPKANNQHIFEDMINKYGSNLALWFQHTFGINDTERLIGDIKYLYQKGIDVILTMHTLYSQRYLKPGGAKSGMRIEEEAFLRVILPYVKAIATMSDCTYNVCVKTFPEFKGKFTEIRHGVHDCPGLTRTSARNNVLRYVSKNGFNADEKYRLIDMLNDDEPMIVSVGFVNDGREDVFKLGKELGVNALHIGDLHPDAVRYGHKAAYEALEKMKEYGEQKNNIFIQCHLDDGIFPSALIMGDLFYGYNENITQSGRTMHGFGGRGYEGKKHIEKGFRVLSADVEGEGETLRMVGMPLVENKEDIAKVADEILFMDREQSEYIDYNITRYRKEYSWQNQFDKHRKLVISKEVPLLDADPNNRFAPEKVPEPKKLEKIVTTSIPPRLTGTYDTSREHHLVG